MHLDMLWICTTLCVNKAMKDIVKAETSEEDLFMHCGSTGCPDFITTCLHTVWSLTVWMDNYLNWQCRFSGTPPFPPPLKNMKERHNMVGFEEIEYGGEACHFGAVPVLRKTLQCRWWCFIPSVEACWGVHVDYTAEAVMHICLPWACVGSVCLCYS